MVFSGSIACNDKVVDCVSELMDLERNEVLSPGKYKKVVEARSVVCYWAMREIGISSKRFGPKVFHFSASSKYDN
jgi:chromosomal replication initiation ATPase DnaA